MLILANLSGIQDRHGPFAFAHFFIQLVSEAVGIRLIRAVGLEENRIIFSAAEKIAIDGTGLTTDGLNRVREETRLIETWLRDKTHARLRVSMVSHDRPGQPIAEQYLAAGRALENAKLRGWSRVAASPNG